MRNVKTIINWLHLVFYTSLTFLVPEEYNNFAPSNLFYMILEKSLLLLLGVYQHIAMYARKAWPLCPGTVTIIYASNLAYIEAEMNWHRF